jgi:glycosyltransferase involved in cell wall biosynthesis
MRSARILVVAPYSVRFDNRHGGKVVAQLMRQLVERHEVALVYLDDPGRPFVDPQLEARLAVVRRVPRPGAGSEGGGWRHRFSVLGSPLTRRPSPVASVYTRQLVRAVQEVAATFAPEVIQIEHDAIAYAGRALRGLPVASLLVCHDPGLLASEDMARLTRGRQRLAHLLDIANWHSYWRATLPRFDALVAFTPADAAALRRVVPTSHVRCIPLGIELPATAADPGTGAGVVFVGGYSHLPNADAAVRLMREIMPRVRRQVPDMRLLVVGDKPTPEMRDAAGPADVVTGPVDQVEPYLERSAVVALPIRIGGGMRVKLLEALAAGRAVVASPLAAAGLEVEDGQELLIADEDDEFAAGIVRLAEDPELRRAMGERARAWALRHLGWEARVKQYEALYQELLEARRR